MAPSMQNKLSCDGGYLPTFLVIRSFLSSSNQHINIIIVFCTRVLVVFLIFFSSEKRLKTQRTIKCCKNLMVSPFSLSPPLGWPGAINNNNNNNNNNNLMVSPFSLSPPLGWPGAIRFGLFGNMGGVPLLFWTLDHKPGTAAA